MKHPYQIPCKQHGYDTIQYKLANAVNYTKHFATKILFRGHKSNILSSIAMQLRTISTTDGVKKIAVDNVKSNLSS